MTANDLVVHEGNDVLVEYLLLLVCQVLEAPEGILKGRIAELIAEIGELFSEGMPTRQFAENQ